MQGEYFSLLSVDDSQHMIFCSILPIVASSVERSLPQNVAPNGREASVISRSGICVRIAVCRDTWLLQEGTNKS